MKKSCIFKILRNLSIGLLSLLFSVSCSENISERNNNLALLLAANSVQSSSVQYGSLSISQGSGSRALDVSNLSSVTVTVSGSGMDDISVPDVSISDGAGYVVVSKIPVGKNRVVTVSSNVDGAVIRAVADIAASDENSCSVGWDTTAIGNIFYNLVKSGYDVSSVSESDFEDCIPDVHASLVNAAQIASDFAKSSLKDADKYVLDYGTVTVSAKNIKDYTVQVTDIASAKTVVSGSDETFALKAYPGTWKVKFFDASGSLKETKDIVVAGGLESSVEAVHVEGSAPVTGKIIVHVPIGLGYSSIWAWSTSSPSTNYTGGTWPGKQMTLNGSYYDYTLNYTSANIVFNDNNKGNVTGTNKTNDLYLTEGEWNYTGGKSGSNDTDGSKISKNFEKCNVEESFTVTVKNPEVPLAPTVRANYSDGDEIGLTDSITFTVTSENTSLSSGTYKIGSYSGTLSVGTTTVSLAKAGITSKGSFTVTAAVSNKAGSESLSIALNAVEQEDPGTPTRLGAFYEKCGTSFSIWSPDKSDVKVAVKKPGESDFKTYTCEAGFNVDGGYSDSGNIYGITLKGDYNLAEYQFYIGGNKVRDPYGKMVKYEDKDAKTNVIKENYSESNCMVTSYAGSSINIVVDVDSILPTSGSWYSRPALSNRAKSVVYEIHVGDFTSSSTWKGTSSYKGKFRGLVEGNTSYSNGSVTVKTGLDHLVELGVTHVQIMPMYDFATKVNHTFGEFYNWGYDPVNYNVPEDRYSLDPSDYEERIREVKDMVNILHKNGIRVIMDVVYNHSFDKEMFNKISGTYYTSSDRSGCGNSVNVSNSMVSRMVRDSLEYWLTTFNLDGFRFDLMGIYTKDAMKDWGEYLNRKYADRTLLLYGEPYQACNDDTNNRVYANLIPDLESAGIGAFSHKYRETIKGGSDDAVKGYMFNSTEKDGNSTAENMEVGLKGSCGSSSDVWTRYFTKKSYQAVNYISAHDNLCLYDKIVRAGITDSSYQKALVKFGHGIVVLSQGVSFLHGGDDFLRTKGNAPRSEFLIDSRTAKENSYMFGHEMNEIDWSRKAAYYDVFKYHKDLIAFRLSHDGFYNGNANTSKDGMTIFYTVKDSNGTELKCVLNPGSNFSYSGSGKQIFNKSGNVSSDSKTCEGTGVTIFKN